MGINLHAFRFIYKISKTRNFGNTLTIGRQKITADKFVIHEILNCKKISDTYLDNYLINYFGSTKVDVLDVNNYENANIIHNLNNVIPSDLIEKYDVIIDGGSLEHVFDIKTALNNLKKMCKIGGTIIHISPTNNFCGHGFYQFSPNLFHSFYNENQGFKDTSIILCKVFDSTKWYKVKRENYKNNKRIDIISNEETFVLSSTTKIENINNSENIQQSDYSENFYNEKKNNENKARVIKQNTFKIKLKKILKKIYLIKKIYNFFRKSNEYKNSKLDKNNKNLQIIKL